MKPLPIVEQATVVSNAGLADFTTIDPNVLADQITKIDSEFFQRLRPLDFIEQIWSSKPKAKPTSTANPTGSESKEDPTKPQKVEKKLKSPIIEAWAKRFNQVSYWVGTEICTVPSIKKRVIVLESMIRLLKVCSMQDLCFPVIHT